MTALVSLNLESSTLPIQSLMAEFSCCGSRQCSDSSVCASLRIKERMMQVGLGVVLLMGFVIFNDISNGASQLQPQIEEPANRELGRTAR